MKINGLRGACLLAVVAMAAGCADGASEDVKAVTSCTANVCKDTVTLRLCENGVFGKDVDCPLGCVNDACVQQACTMNTCADSLTLAQCLNGQVYNIACPNGCENGMCKTAPGNTCIQSVCQDANTLLNCVNGVQTPTPCPYGCDNGNCRAACTADVCKDGGTLSICDNGIAKDVACDLGCTAGKCNTACLADFCRDSSILMMCDEGQIRPVSCPYGCANDKCNTKEGACSENSVSCDGAYVQTCLNGNWVKASTPCEEGCENGVCKGNGPSEDCTNGEKRCDGNNLLTCKNNSWTTEKCDKGCENNACIGGSTGPKCTGGYEECDSTCKVTDGRTCAAACQDEYQSDVCCMDDTNIYCEDPGSIPDSMTCSEYESSKNTTCKLTDGTTCADYCTSQGYDTCCVNLKQGMIDCSCKGSTPAETCDEKTYKESCDGNTVHYCSGGEVVEFACDASTPCAVNATSGIADCTQPCKAGDADSVYCYDYYGLGIMFAEVPMVCQKTTTGSYAYFLNSAESKDCEAGCTAGVGCDASAPACTNGDLQCNGNKLEVCSEGAWTTKENCTNGCENKACKSSTSTCTTGDLQCNGNKLELCVNGTWSEQKTCENGCENKACKDAPTTCTNDELQCNGNVLEICTGGAWTTKETCKNGCADGACNPDVTVPEPTGGNEGDPCDASTYVEGCDGQTIQYCYNSKVDYVDCSASGLTCHVLSQNGTAYADCFDDSMKCTTPGETGVAMCYEYGYYGDVTFSHNCYPATDGGAYYAIDWDGQKTQCEGECNAEGTACAEVETCSESTYTEYCDGNTGYYCSDGKVKTLTCSSSSAPCRVSSVSGAADCASSCTKGTASKYYCYNYGSTYAIPENCEETTSGGYAWFLDYNNAKVCSGSCSETAGCQ